MMMMVKFSLDLAYLGQSFHSWRRNSRINRGSIRRTKKFHSFFSLERERKRGKKEETKERSRWRRIRYMEREFWNNTVDPTPTIGPLYRRQRTFTHNGTQLVSLGESSRAAKVPSLVLFISYERSRIPRYTGCTRAGQFREFEKREKRVRLSELSVYEKRRGKGKKSIEYLKCLNIDSKKYYL